MSLPIYQVDAFTSERFKGNPAAVCLLKEQRDVAWMQNVAAEMNLSETAFVLPEKDGSFGIRWCTPTVEVDLCGHATLASSHVLLEIWIGQAGRNDRIHKQERPAGCPPERPMDRTGLPRPS